MNQDPSRKPWVEPSWFENQAKIPAEELARYAGRHVAWSPDGLRVVESGADFDELIRKLDAAGIDTGQVVLDFVEIL